MLHISDAGTPQNKEQLKALYLINNEKLNIHDPHLDLHI